MAVHKQPLLCRKHAHVGSAPLSGAMANLVLAVLGAGQLTLPYALSQMGLGFGLLALVVFALLSVHSLYTLSVHELHFTPEPSDCIESYAELVVRVLGPPGKLLCNALLALYAWGGAVSFLVILKGELAYLAARSGFQLLSGGFLMAIVAACFIFPLSSLEDLTSLKRFSPLGCTAAIFITIVVLAVSPWNGEFPLGVDTCMGIDGLSTNTLEWWPTSFIGVSAALPLLSFALNSSWAYVPILCTLKGKTESRVVSLIFGANAIILLNYMLLATYGYATYCSSTTPNILDSLGEHVPAAGVLGRIVLLARVALSVQLSLALPMRFMVTRRTLTPGGCIGTRMAVSGTLVGAAAGLAAMPLSLALVLGIVSSICASMIIYILPAIIDLRIQLPGFSRKIVSAFSLLVGFFVLGAGLVANLMGTSAGA